jgi:hypothetical protein
MSYDISIQEKQGYIRVEVSGERTSGQEAKAAIDLWMRLAEVCNDKGIFRVLAIYDLNGDLPTIAAYEIGSSLVKNDLIRNMKVALVDLNEKSRENNLFAKTVAVNRAYSRDSGRVFDDEKKAIEWLLGQ